MAHWSTDWKTFVESLQERISQGMTADEIEKEYRNQTVQWSGTITRKNLHLQPGEGHPVVGLEMPRVVLRTADEKTTEASVVNLRFDRTPSAISRWWRVPVGTTVRFEATLGDAVFKCIDCRYDKLGVSFFRNARLVAPSEYCYDEPIDPEVYKALEVPARKISRTFAAPEEIEISVGESELPELGWEQSEHQGVSRFERTVLASMNVEAALVTFWRDILRQGPPLCRGDWSTIHVNVRAEMGCITVQFGSEDMRTFEPVCYVLWSPAWEQLVLGHVAAFNLETLDDDGLDLLGSSTMSLIEQLWRTIHAALCTGPALKALRELVASRSIRILGSGDSDEELIELQIPVRVGSKKSSE